MTGNTITGEYNITTTGAESLSLVETGTNAGGAYSVTETTLESPQIVETGNSQTGSFSLTDVSTQAYTFDEKNTATNGNTFTMHETGSAPTTVRESGSSVSGAYSQTTTGTDNYTLTETGSKAETGLNGTLIYTETLTASDNSTTTETGNTQSGQFQRSETGNTSGTLIETGTDRGTPFELPSTVSPNYSLTETGDYSDNKFTQTESGSDRYALMEQSNNTSNAATGSDPGTLDSSPNGPPLAVAQGGDSPGAVPPEPMSLRERLEAQGFVELPKIGRAKYGVVTVNGREFEMGPELYSRWQAAANRGVVASIFTGMIGFPESLERVNAEVSRAAERQFAQQDLYKGKTDSWSYELRMQASNQQINAMDFDRLNRTVAGATLALPVVSKGLGAAGRLAGIGVEGVAAEGLAAEATAQEALRQRVLANIAESAATREAGNFEIYLARESQVLSRYNADKFWLQPIPKGSIVYGGTPGQSAWYTNAETALASHLDREAFFKSLQVQPHPSYGYRPAMQAYRVLEDIVVPAGTAANNPAFGSGGGWQYFIKAFKETLLPIREFPLSDF